MPDPTSDPPSTEPKPDDPNTALDRAIEDSFPASDPPAQTVITGPGEPDDRKPAKPAPQA